MLYLVVLESTFAIHEYGHLREYQKRNVPIKEFSLGIGPRIWHREVSSFQVSVRLVPIMAYVEATPAGDKFFEQHVPLRGKIAVHAGGVRNNLLLGLGIVLLLQCIGWARGKISFWEFTLGVIKTPFRILLRFLAFLLGCITFGRVQFGERFLLSTGKISPPKLVRKLILLNLTLGIMNFAPIPPLDGGHAFQSMLAAWGGHFNVFELPIYAEVILFGAFYISLQKQDMRVLEFETVDPDYNRPKRFRSINNAGSSRGRIFPREMDRWELEGKEVSKSVLKHSLELLPTLSLRVIKLLANSNIATIGQLRECTEQQLLRIRNIGPVAIEEIETTLRYWNLSLKPVDEE